MKPRIRWYRSLGVWVVWAGKETTVHHTWPEALAMIGIPCPEGWTP